MIYKYICFDGNNLFWRSYTSLLSQYKKLNKEITNIFSESILVSLKTINRITKNFGNNDSLIYFLFDNPDSIVNKRKIISQGYYKLNREKEDVPKQFYKVLSVFQDILKNYSDNFSILMSEKCEADDLTFPLQKYLETNQRNKILWISADLDWARNIYLNNDWYNFNDLYSEKEFFKKYKFWPKNDSLKLYKALAGDVSDNIKKPIPYLPENIILMLVNKYDMIDKLKNSLVADIDCPEKWKTKILENWTKIKINYQLVDFITVALPIEDFIIQGHKNKLILKIWYKSLKIPLEPWMLTRQEKNKDFFKKRKFDLK